MESVELKQKCEILDRLIQNGYVPKTEIYYQKLWLDFAVKNEKRVKILALQLHRLTQNKQ